MSSKVILYKGRRGAGKTLTMVKDAYLYYLEGYKVLGNFETEFSEYISEEDILNLDKDSLINNCIILLDEIQIFFDSRRSMAKQNLNFSNFIQQVRKRNITLLATSQYSNTIDLRFRQHIDIMAFPQFLEKYPVCVVTYIDLTTMQDDILDFAEPTQTKLVYNPIPIFKLYNTNEMIK